MSVIIGLINEGSVIISADTMLANLSTPSLSKHGFKKIFEFELDGFNYLIGAAGLGEDLAKFLKTLSCYVFEKPNYSGKDLANEFNNILKSNFINKLTLLIGSTNSKPSIYRVRFDTVQEITQENQYFILAPDSADTKRQELDNFMKNNAYILERSALEFLRLIIKEIANIDNYRFVNDDFYYVILDKSNKIKKPIKTDKGYTME